MQQSRAREIRGVVDAVRTLTGLGVTWKWYDASDSAMLPTSVTNHQSRFCDAVKGRAPRNVRCKQTDVYDLAESRRPHSHPFRKTCHAGVVELVVPVVRGEVCVGAFMLGPFRTTRTRCCYPDTEKEYRTLPTVDRRTLLAAEHLLSFAASRLAARDDDPVPATPQSDSLDPRIEQAARFVRDRLGQRVSLSQAADHCCLSVSRLSHLFSTEMGEPFSRYVARVTIDEAKRLMAQTTLGVGKVAAMLGFTNADYFSALFRSVVGESPLQYRKGHRVAHEA